MAVPPSDVDLVTEELHFTTADIERMYFSTPISAPAPQQAEPHLPDGLYRIVNGQLYRIVAGAPMR